MAINAAAAFTFLVKNGSKLDKEAPYLPLALYNNRLNTTPLVQEMVVYKCGKHWNYIIKNRMKLTILQDINKYLPAYLKYGQSTTILGWTLGLFKDNEPTSRVDHW